jgi:hypothetical protein
MDWERLQLLEFVRRMREAQWMGPRSPQPFNASDMALQGSCIR